MRFLARFVFLFIFCSVCGLRAQNEENTAFITSRIFGQLGNNLFQIAATSALAWDNNIEAYFPALDPHSLVTRHVFFRVNNSPLPKPVSFEWSEPAFSYNPIPYIPNMQISGYFQSEKYFAHHREKLLQLFAPLPEDFDYIQNTYAFLLSHPETVGIQIRYYKWEFPTEDLFPQYGKDYLEAAMSLFPESSLFVVSSNNLEFAKKSIPEWAKNIYFIENEPHYIDFHLLSLCKHNIITNSSFGWWSAWLNRNPEKIVVRPKIWINGLPTQDVCPDEWISLLTKYE